MNKLWENFDENIRLSSEQLMLKQRSHIKSYSSATPPGKRGLGRTATIILFPGKLIFETPPGTEAAEIS